MSKADKIMYIHRKRYSLFKYVFIAFLLPLGQSSYSKNWEEIYPIAEDVPGDFSYESTSKKNYENVTLKVLAFDGLVGNAASLHAKTFEELTGAKVVVDRVPFSELYPKARRGIKLGEYDVVFHLRNWLVDLEENIEPIPSNMINSREYKDMAEPFKRLGRWNGEVVEVTIDGDKHNFQYRKDLLEDPEIKRQYQKERGKPLEVPTTWKELNEVASFFHGKTFNGKTVYGICEPTNPNGYLYSAFFKRASSYASHPDDKGGFYFDITDMSPRIDSPGFVEALKDMVEAAKYYPPNWHEISVTEVMDYFANGQVVFIDFWDDSFILAMEEDKPTRNKVLAGPSLGSNKVWNRRTKSWDVFEEPNRVPYLAEGWSSGVSSNSKNKEVAFQFLGFLSNEANHRVDILYGERGINLFRVSDNDAQYFAENSGWDLEVSRSLMNSFEHFMTNENRTMFLQIGSSNEYNKSISTSVFRALKGQIEPEDALRLAAEDWNKYTKSFGVEDQKIVYLNSVRFEDNID